MHRSQQHPPSQTMVRMVELAAGRRGDEDLVSLGLGSCIGRTLLDRRVGVAGLAHIVLPARGDHREANRLKFADVAVPELISRVLTLGERRLRLEAVLVGGASMFANAGQRMEVGQRNEAAVRSLLASERIRIVAAETGGSRGRTVRVRPAEGFVTVRAAGGSETALYPTVDAHRSLQMAA
jgi:chemotaxis protein CheD